MKFTHDKSVGLLVLRLVLGVTFIIFGYVKYSDMTSTVGFFGQMGFAPFWAYLVTAVEMLGGLSLIIGYGSKVSSMLLSIIMLVAMYKVYPMGFVAGIALPFVTFGGTAAIFFAGPGYYGFGPACGCPKTCPCESGKGGMQK